MSIKLWEITAALKPTVFLLVMVIFLLALRAQRRRKQTLDLFGPWPFWVVAATYWYAPIYDTVIGPLSGFGVMTPAALPFLAYVGFALIMAALFYAAAYWWRTGRRVLALALVIGLNLYGSTVFDYHEGATLGFMARHLVNGSVGFSLLFLGILWARESWRRRYALVLSLIGIFAIGNSITGAVLQTGEALTYVAPFFAILVILGVLITRGQHVGKKVKGGIGLTKVNWKLVLAIVLPVLVSVACAFVIYSRGGECEERAKYALPLMITLYACSSVLVVRRKELWYRAFLVWYLVVMGSFTAAFLIPGMEPYGYVIEAGKGLGLSGGALALFVAINPMVVWYYGYCLVGIKELLRPSTALKPNRVRAVHVLCLVVVTGGTLNVLASAGGFNGWLGLNDTVILGTMWGTLYWFRPWKWFTRIHLGRLLLNVIYVFPAMLSSQAGIMIGSLGGYMALGAWTDLMAINGVASAGILLSVQERGPRWKKVGWIAVLLLMVGAPILNILAYLAGAGPS